MDEAKLKGSVRVLGEPEMAPIVEKLGSPH